DIGSGFQFGRHLLGSVAHAAQQAERLEIKKLRWMPFDFEIFFTLVVDTDPNRAVTILWINVLFPGIRWLQNVSIGINDIVVWNTMLKITLHCVHNSSTPQFRGTS